jgi:hypothetical protein
MRPAGRARGFYCSVFRVQRYVRGVVNLAQNSGSPESGQTLRGAVVLFAYVMANAVPFRRELDAEVARSCVRRARVFYGSGLCQP